MQLHEACEPLAFLLGTWQGEGEGHYPTIEPFRYLEEVSFAHVGKPFLSYAQKTRDAATGAPLHAETGYFRGIGSGGVELVIAQPSGIVELHRGVVTGGLIEFELESVHTTGTAKSVTDVQRTLRVERDAATDETVMTYDLSMAAVGQPMTHHLHARLVRQDD